MLWDIGAFRLFDLRQALRSTLPFSTNHQILFRLIVSLPPMRYSSTSLPLHRRTRPRSTTATALEELLQLRGKLLLEHDENSGCRFQAVNQCMGNENVGVEQRYGPQRTLTPSVHKVLHCSGTQLPFRDGLVIGDSPVNKCCTKTMLGPFFLSENCRNTLVEPHPVCTPTESCIHCT